jgi:hypothetical protein
MTALKGKLVYDWFDKLKVGKPEWVLHLDVGVDKKDCTRLVGEVPFRYNAS